MNDDYMVGILDYDKMNWIWVRVSEVCDINLEGLCWHEGRLCRFKTENGRKDNTQYIPICRMYQLKFRDKLRWLWKKKKFEWCIGYHRSYPKKLYKERKPKFFWKWVFGIYYFGLSSDETK